MLTFFLNYRCTNQTCRQAMEIPRGLGYRYWNRDLSACLNMLQIVRSLRLNRGIPDIFRRATAPPERRRRRTEGQVGQRRVRQRRT